MNRRALRGILLFWTLFIGLGAVGGAITMFYDPSGVSTGMDGLLPGLQKLPFSDVLFTNLIFSGISLLIVNGFNQLVGFVLLIKKHKAACRWCLGCGVVLMLWICIQFVIFPLNFLSTAYFIFGLLEALAAFLLKKKERVL